MPSPRPPPRHRWRVSTKPEARPAAATAHHGGQPSGHQQPGAGKTDEGVAHLVGQPAVGVAPEVVRASKSEHGEAPEGSDGGKRQCREGRQCGVLEALDRRRGGRGLDLAGIAEADTVDGRPRLAEERRAGDVEARDLVGGAGGDADLGGDERVAGLGVGADLGRCVRRPSGTRRGTAGPRRPSRGRSSPGRGCWWRTGCGRGRRRHRPAGSPPPKRRRCPWRR